MATISQVVSLNDVRTHLRMPATFTVDDIALEGFISAATAVVVNECGDIIPANFDEYYDGGDLSIWTRHTPLLSVSNVEEGWGWTNYELDYVQVNMINMTSMFAYSIDEPSTGEISRRSGGNINIPFMKGSNNIRVTYSAGQAAVPGNVRLAALELIAHWWQGGQQRESGSANPYDAVDTSSFTRTTAVSSINFGVPYRIIELLKPNRRLPIIG